MTNPTAAPLLDLGDEATVARVMVSMLGTDTSLESAIASFGLGCPPDQLDEVLDDHGLRACPRCGVWTKRSTRRLVCLTCDEDE